MKIFRFDDNNGISYTADGVTRELDKETLENLKALHNCQKDEQYINSEMERNKAVISDNNASTIQKKVADESLSTLEKNKIEIGNSMRTLIDKVKEGIGQSKSYIEEANAEKKEIQVDSKDPVLELLCALINQDATGKYTGERKDAEGVAVPQEKEEEFIQDMAKTLDKENDQKLIELSGKGYDLVPVNQSMATTPKLEEDQALVIISKDKQGVERIIAFDNPADALSRKNDPAFKEEFFGVDKQTNAYSVSKREFLSNAMKIYADSNKNELVSKLPSTKLIYSKEAETLSLETKEGKRLESPKPETQDTSNKYGFNTKEYSNCAINIENVNWEQFKRLGITPEDLHRKGQLKKLLNGEKTDLLLVRTKNSEGVMMTGNFKFQLSTDDILNPKLMMAGVRAKLNIPDNFHGVELSQEDKQLLKEKGTLYREVEIAGEKRLIYIDKQTNEICTRRTRDIVVPDKIRDKELSAEQKEALRTGRPVLVMGFVSKEGNKYDAWVFLNPEKNSIKIDFENPLYQKNGKEEKTSNEKKKQNKLSV